MPCKYLMNPVCQTDQIRISSTDNDAFMLRTESMETDEVPAIESYDDPALGTREFENSRVGCLLVRQATLLHREHVMTQLPETISHGEWDVLVRVERSHRLGFLMLANSLLDLISVGTIVGPGIRQILGA